MAVEQKEFYSIPARVLYNMGRWWLSSLPGKLLTLFAKSMLAIAFMDRRKFRTEFRQIISQVFFTGIEAVPLIFSVAVLLGTLTITQAMTYMPKVGFGDFFGNLMVIIIIRELGPVLTAFLIAGRTGAALAAYLGNMRVESEVDALETMGIDPVKYLVMPAVAGGMIAMVMINIFFSTVAIVVGFFVAKALLATAMSNMVESKLIWDNYFSSILMGLKPMDFIMVIVKPTIFGAIIAVNACHFGLSAQNDVRQVPKATSSSVVYSFAFVVLADLVLSLAYILEYMRGFNAMI